MSDLPLVCIACWFMVGGTGTNTIGALEEHRVVGMTVEPVGTYGGTGGATDIGSTIGADGGMGGCCRCV